MFDAYLLEAIGLIDDAGYEKVEITYYDEFEVPEKPVIPVMDKKEVDPVAEFEKRFNKMSFEEKLAYWAQEEAFFSGSQASMPISKVDTLNFVRP